MSTPTLTGLIGDPVSHSLSPKIHSYWAKEYNIATDYKLFTTKPARLRQTMLHMRKKNALGLNITIPHKQSISEYLDGVDDIARRIGAVNTVITQKGKMIGTNTDAYGFITNLKQSLGMLDKFLKKVVILGAGGATRAAIIALKDAGAGEIVLTNRTAATATTMAGAFGLRSVPWEERDEAVMGANLLINTTSLGMVGKPPLTLDINGLSDGAAVHDIVYAPLETELLAAARQQGYVTVDGLGMLLYQAQKAFELWHGILPEVTDDLRAHILEKD
jgi:shikimate dehydrogenase